MSNLAEISRLLRKKLNWTQQELADQLLVSRNYIALIESGKKEGSMRLLRAMQAFLVNVDSAHSQSTPAEESKVVAESPAVYGSPLAEEAQRLFSDTLSQAGNDPARLGWIIEQLLQHLRPPAHWHSPSGRNAKIDRMIADMKRSVTEKQKQFQVEQPKGQQADPKQSAGG